MSGGAAAVTTRYRWVPVAYWSHLYPWEAVPPMPALHWEIPSLVFPMAISCLRRW